MYASTLRSVLGPKRSSALRSGDLAVVPRGEKPTADPRAAWKLFASHFHLFDGTPSWLWLNYVFSKVFGLEVGLEASTADLYFDSIGEALARPEFRPRALFERAREHHRGGRRAAASGSGRGRRCAGPARCVARASRGSASERRSHTVSRAAAPAMMRRSRVRSSDRPVAGHSPRRQRTANRQIQLTTVRLQEI